MWWQTSHCWPTHSRSRKFVLSNQRDGLTPDEIVLAFPTLTLADLYAALAYYFDSRAEIDADIRLTDEFDAQLSWTAPLSGLNSTEVPLAQEVDVALMM